MHSGGHAMNLESPMIAHEPVLGLKAVCSREVAKATVNGDGCPGVSIQLHLLPSDVFVRVL